MASLPPPRKRPHVREELGNPLPVPVASLTGLPVSTAAWQYYFARYKDGVITVVDQKHADSLWHNGYFGHGRFVKTDSKCRFLQKKRWKLIQADGIKGGTWLKDQCMESNASDENGSNDDNSQSEGELGCTQSEVEPGCSGIEKDTSLNEQCDSNDSVTVINTYRKFKVLDPNIKKCSETVLVLNSDRGDSSSDGSDTYAHEGYLKLLPEEALFLSYALGCLVVTQEKIGTEKQNCKRASSFSEKEEDHEMTIDQMWNAFIRDDPNFPVKYAVYHHYRTKGWVVKSGLKYGADWALYPVGPPFYHSQYTVMIQCVWLDSLNQDDLSWREWSWTNVSVTERLNNHVNKTPLICFVLRPRSLTDEKLRRIDCLKELIIQEILLSRWNPNDNEL